MTLVERKTFSLVAFFNFQLMLKFWGKAKHNFRKDVRSAEALAPLAEWLFPTFPTSLLARWSLHRCPLLHGGDKWIISEAVMNFFGYGQFDFNFKTPSEFSLVSSITSNLFSIIEKSFNGKGQCFIIPPYNLLA